MTNLGKPQVDMHSLNPTSVLVPSISLKVALIKVSCFEMLVLLSVGSIVGPTDDNDQPL